MDLIKENKEGRDARNNLKKTAETHYSRPTRGSHTRLKAAKTALDNVYRKLSEDNVKSEAEQLEKAHYKNRHVAAWGVLRDLTSKKLSPVVKIKGTDINKPLNSWYLHFTFLGKLEQHPIDLKDPFYNHKASDELPISTSPFNIAEVQTCLRKISNSKTLSYKRNFLNSAIKHLRETKLHSPSYIFTPNLRKVIYDSQNL